MRCYEELILSLQPQQKLVDLVQVISEQISLSPAIVKKGIKQNQLRLNKKVVYHTEITPLAGLSVKFQGINIELTPAKELPHFDRYVNLVFKELGGEEFSENNFEKKKVFCAFIIAYFSDHTYEKVYGSRSLQLENALNELEILYREHFKEKDSKTPRRKELVENLLMRRIEQLTNLKQNIEGLQNGFFSNNLHKFLQEFVKITNQEGFQQLIAPLIPASIYLRTTIQSIIKPITDSVGIAEIDKKYIHFENNRYSYESYLNLINDQDKIQKNIFAKLGQSLFSLFKIVCDTHQETHAKIEFAGTSRKYNFDYYVRTDYDLFIIIKNSGDGLAREIIIRTQHSPLIINGEFKVGVLKPGQTRELALPATLSDQPASNYELSVECSWLDNQNKAHEVKAIIGFALQKMNTPWDELQLKKPYSILEIEERNKLYGRDEILKELELNILSEKIESYKIWGQKRVGKSSIVKTLKTIFNDEEKIVMVYRSIAGLKNVDAIATLNTLGESLCSEIFDELIKKITNPTQLDQLRKITVPEFSGSLYPLEQYIRQLRVIDNKLKFVLILDEFDRINEEFFQPGKLGESLSLNIGKGLNSYTYVGIILIGSENMHLLDRQEMNYNNFQSREVDTFDRKNQFDEFTRIIVEPVFPHISYSSEAIAKIYDETSGNPYFVNYICALIFKNCARYRDNEVDLLSASSAIDNIVESSQKAHFEHFWGDGIWEDSSIKKEKKTDLRRRILVAYSLAFSQNSLYPGKEDIIRNFKKPTEYVIEPYEIENTVREFLNRKIFYEQHSTLRIKPSLFERWLCGPGKTLMIEGVSDLEALQREKQLEATHVIKVDELKSFVENIRFEPATLSADILNNYLVQFGSPFEQRRIFNLLQSIYYISKADIIEFLKKERKAIFGDGEINVKLGAKTPYREHIELYSFASTTEENKTIIETFKSIWLIRPSKTLKDITHNKDSWKQNNATNIIVFESVVDDFRDIQSELFALIDEKLLTEGIPINFVTLLITTKAKADLIKATSSLTRFKLFAFREVEETKIKPFIETTEIFQSAEEASIALAEVRKQYQGTSDECINVLFESHCPGKSVPVFWHANRLFTPLFPNKTGRIYQQKNDIGEKLTPLKVSNYYNTLLMEESTKKTIKIFIASSVELKHDREQFELFLNRENKKLFETKNLFLELVNWEDFNDALSNTRKQDDYNAAIADCDVFVLLCGTKLGKYSGEEFQTALKTFKENGKPLIYTYFKDVEIKISDIAFADFNSLHTFKELLNDLGHFYTRYSDIHELVHHFKGQLEKHHLII